MNDSLILRISREKHLDHMVKVVPFIVFCYGVHSYILMSVNGGPVTMKGILVLGTLLATMISGLVLYDIKHIVELHQKEMIIHFLWMKKKVHYDSILKVEVLSPQETFSTLKITTKSRSYHLFFIDEADKVKSWICDKQTEESKKAA